MDVYNLINSKAIQKHCREIKHQFNTEEIAVLIYRNKSMSIEEKINAYKELIDKYPDMESIKRRWSKEYNSVKEMIKEEIERIQNLLQILKNDEQDVLYYYNYWCNSNYNTIIEGKDEFRDIYKTYKEVQEIVNEEIERDEEKEIISFTIRKRTVSKQNKFDIIAEYTLDQNRNLKMVNIYDYESGWLDIANICLNIPTPFKKGDLLLSVSKTPFSEGSVLSYNRFPFVLVDLVTWNENFQKLLAKGCYDCSDMQGPGYIIGEDGKLFFDNVFDYDSWEYFEGELEGKQRLLKASSSLMKDEIGIDFFLEAYKYIENEANIKSTMLPYFVEEYLPLVGLSEKDIKKLKTIKD